MIKLTNLFMVTGILALIATSIFTIYALIWFAAYLWDKWRFRKEPVEDWTWGWDRTKEILKGGEKSQQTKAE